MMARSGASLAGVLGVVGLLALAPAAAAQPSPTSALAEWGRGLELDAGVLDQLDRFRDGDGRVLPERYRRSLASSARRDVFQRAGRELERLLVDDCRPRIDVSFDEPPPTTDRVDGGSRPGVVEAFEESLLRIEMVACLDDSEKDPGEVLALYTDPDFRRSTESRIEGIREEDGLSCVTTGGVTALLDPTRACNRIDRFGAGAVAAEHSQVVSNPAEGDDGYQVVYFKESLKTFVRLSDGIALHYVHLSRTAGLGRLSRWIGAGKVREAEERKVAALRGALPRP